MHEATYFCMHIFLAHTYNNTVCILAFRDKLHERAGTLNLKMFLFLRIFIDTGKLCFALHSLMRQVSANSLTLAKTQK